MDGRHTFLRHGNNLISATPGISEKRYVTIHLFMIFMLVGVVRADAAMDIAVRGRLRSFDFNQGVKEDSSYESFVTANGEYNHRLLGLSLIGFFLAAILGCIILLRVVHRLILRISKKKK